jgi:threonine dehydrogenase-like Zn-dependent dehydrogenase
VAAVADGGTVFYFGVSDDPVVTFPLDLFQRKHLSLLSGGTTHRRRWLGAAGGYLARHREVLSCVTDVVSFEHADEAFARAARPCAGRLKVVLDFAP